MADPGDEQKWVELSRQGDHVAFENLIHSYQQMVHSLTYRMTGSLTDAEDLTQETFIHAFQQLGSFRQESRFSSWLYRISLNLCLNWQKSTIRREKAYREFAESTFETGNGNSHVAQNVQEALLSLKPKQRAAVVLTVIKGLNHAEAGRVLGCSETTVSWRVFTARRKLKRVLANIQNQS